MVVMEFLEAVLPYYHQLMVIHVKSSTYLRMACFRLLISSLKLRIIESISAPLPPALVAFA